jgi:hypothetical protein
VNISACFGDVQFRWATEPLPIVGCHMCPAGNLLAQRALAQRFRPITSFLWGLQLALLHWTSLRLLPPRTGAPTVHFHLLCFCSWWVHSWASCTMGAWLAWQAWAQSLRACMSRVFCWSRRPGHGGDLRTIGCDAGRWLAQPLGAQSPFTSPRSLTVRTIFARGCG